MILLSHCAPVYVPNTRNVPLFSKASQYQGTVRLGTSGLDIQTAGSVTNHFALTANYAYHWHSDYRSPGYNKFFSNHEYKFYEGGLGYFWKDDNYKCEVFAGYGKGWGITEDEDHYDDYEIDEIRGKYERFFVQPSLGVQLSMVEVAFTCRLSFVDFSELTVHGGPKKNPHSLAFIEPSATARFNLSKRFFFVAQGGGNQLLTMKRVYGLDHAGLIFSIGTGFKLGAKD